MKGDQINFENSNFPLIGRLKGLQNDIGVYKK